MRGRLFVAALFAVVLGGTAALANLVQFGAAGGGGGSFSTWSTASSNSPPGGTLVTISTTTSTNDTATTTTSASNSFVSGTAACSGTKYYFEGTLSFSTSHNFLGVGITNTSYTVTQNIPGFDSGANSVSAIPFRLQADLAGNSIGAIDDITTGGIVGVAVDTGVAKIWIWNNQAGRWNADISANQNPSTPVGGYSLAGLGAGPYRPIGGDTSEGGSGNAVVLNTGATAFVNTLPTGYSACH